MIVMIDSGPDYISRRLIFNLAPAHQGLYPSSRRGFPLCTDEKRLLANIHQ